MLAYFKQKLELLLDSILGPLWQRLMAAPVTVKILVLAVVAVIVLAFSYPEVTRRVYTDSLDIVRAGTADGVRIPVSLAVATDTRATVARLGTTVAGDLLKVSQGYLTPWSAAQAAVAAGGVDAASLDKNAVTAFIRSHMAPNCDCWTELPDDAGPDHCVFISGWIMAAFADMDIPVSKGELHYALRTQRDDGSWPTFDPANGEEYSSTYSTAWLLIGLVRQAATGHVDSSDTQAVKSATTRAAAWLLSHRTGARWKPYPNMATSATSESISGLALHALHLAVPAQVVELDVQWLRVLPERTLAAEDWEKSYVELRAADARFIDHFVQLKLPWMLVATVDAYSQGGLIERARALHWIEATVSGESVHNADSNSNNWWRAELLYSLSYMLRRS